MKLRHALLLAALLAACSGARVQPPPVPAPAPPPAEAGKASFFFPVEIPLAEVRRAVEESPVSAAFRASSGRRRERRLNPLLDQELKRAAGRLLADLALRRKAEEAWRSLHVARRAVKDEDLWIRFQPLEISLARLTLKDGVLHTGIGVAGGAVWARCRMTGTISPLAR